MIMKMSERGDTLISRVEGAEIREKIIEVINKGEQVKLDFSGITRITQSFADELFGKILYDISLDNFMKTISIYNAAEDIRKVIKLSIRQRNEMISKQRNEKRA